MKIMYLIGCIFIGGCANFANGSKQNIGISSTPSKAEVKITGFNFDVYDYKNPSSKYYSIGETNCITPCVLELLRRNSYSILIEKDGYEPASSTIISSISGWVWGNFISWGLIGLTVDLATGSAYKLKPETVNVVLQKKEVSK